MIDKWCQLCHSTDETGFCQLGLKHSTRYVLPLRKTRVLNKAGSVGDGISRNAVLVKDPFCGVSLDPPGRRGPDPFQVKGRTSGNPVKPPRMKMSPWIGIEPVYAGVQVDLSPGILSSFSPEF